MARKIKLPLDMGNDIKVRDIDELKENYNSEKVVESFLNGELLPWLQDRFYDEEAGKVKALSANTDSGNIAGKLAEIFGVQIESEVDVEEIAERAEKLKKLRKITSNDDILNNLDSVAFSQEELADVLDRGCETVYLYGSEFRVPLRMTGRKYIGLNNPMIEIKTVDTFDLNKYKITFSGCTFTNETLAKMFDPDKIVKDGLTYLEKEDYFNALQCFKTAAIYGNHEGEFQYAKTYDLGRGVEKDLEYARKWYTKAALDGSAKACNNLGIIFRDKDQNYAEAFALFKKGYELEERDTLLYNLGIAYVDDKFGINDAQAAEPLLLKAAEHGFKNAYEPLADIYLNDKYNMYDMDKASFWLDKISEGADSIDLEALGDKFMDNTSATYDVQVALKYYDLSLKKSLNDDPDFEDSDLMVKRANCIYKLGRIDEALAEYEREAKGKFNNTDAMEALIEHYRNNYDDAKVKEWCKYYSDYGINGKYICIAADAYYHSDDPFEPVPAENIDKAMELYEQAFVFGYDYAMIKLGDIYVIELDRRDFNKARQCYEAVLRSYDESGMDKDCSDYQDVLSKIATVNENS